MPGFQRTRRAPATAAGRASASAIVQPLPVPPVQPVQVPGPVSTPDQTGSATTVTTDKLAAPKQLGLQTGQTAPLPPPVPAPSFPQGFQQQLSSYVPRDVGGMDTMTQNPLAAVNTAAGNVWAPRQAGFKKPPRSQVSGQYR